MLRFICGALRGPRVDFMKLFKGLQPRRLGLSELLERGFKPVALPHSPWTEEEDAILRSCLRDYAEDPSVVGEWGSGMRYL